LDLQYTPAAAASGTLSLSYSYSNNADAPKTGSLNVDYRATTNDNAVASANPPSLAVSAGTVTPVTVTFTTDDGNPAGSLTVISGLGPLPAGWNGPATFTCASFAAGNACQLSLSYVPTAADTGTLTLAYDYMDDSGTAKSGSVSIGYIATP
ncbi:MAG TPA: hypothetical protein VHV81_15305, partial [Steroidobacteraceae bacterium]|nr:hypothetical protein [Steroidobacteraceae bacterium]